MPALSYKPGSQICLAKLILLVVLSSLIQAETQAQAPGGRQSTGRPTPTPTPVPNVTGGRGKTNGPTRGPVPIKLATLAINLPPGSRIWLNQIEVEVRHSDRPIKLGIQKITTTYSMDRGVFTISGLKPGACVLSVRKPDHREFVQTLDLFHDRINEITVHLTPIPGTLTVKPSVTGASVEVVNSETNSSFGSYMDQLDRVELAPGNYRVSTSKTGYVTATREITIKPGESIYLEPFIELLPKPKPTPPPAVASAGQFVPTAFHVQTQDKEEIFYIRGSSANASTTLGTISVRHGGESRVHAIDGALNGLPCQVDFVRLENVAEGAVIRAPGPSNQWSEIVIRLRRKDKKRPVIFAVNWKSLQPTEALDHGPQPESFTPARALQKIKPNFPAAARRSQGSATVNVLVFIDAFGTVISAKALDGPNIFRQVCEEAARNWKFSPAIRDGVAVESQQTIQFTFQH